MHTPPHITHKASCIKLRSDIQSASHRAFTLQATGVAMANATCLGYQNIPVNLDEALLQIGRYLYGVQHHERAQRVTHSLEALDEGSGTEVREQGR
jgi:hypothetical protein